MAGDDEEGRGLVPKLRFPAFKDSALHKVQLGHVTEEGTIRNKGRLGTDVIMGVSKENGMVPMQAHVIASDISRYKVIRKDWFAYNPMRLNIGSIARWHGDDDALVSPDYVVFHCPKRSKEPSLLPVYFDHFRRSAQWDAFTNEAGDGGVRVRIYYSDIAQVRLVLPDTDEQQKIADCLTSLDASIAAEGDRLAALKTHKKGLMQQLFPGEGQTTPRLRFPAFEGAEEWEVKPFRCMFKVGSGRDYKHLSEGNIPVYGSGGLMLTVNDYLYDGESACIGRKGTIDKPLLLTGKFWTVDTLFYTYDFEDCLPRFVFAIFQQIEWAKHNEAGGVPSLSKTNIEAIEVAIPKLEEQAELVNFLTNLDYLVASQIEAIDALKLLKKALMQQLFPSPDGASA